MPWLINAAQLDKFRKNQKNVTILDASLHIDGRNGQEEFLEKHIVDARFFDIATFSDPDSAIPYTLLKDEKRISDLLGKLGIRNDHKIIIYVKIEVRKWITINIMLLLFLVLINYR